MRSACSATTGLSLRRCRKRVGAQINPFTYLRVTPNPSGAHLTHLAENWEKFYSAKRSSATRRRDRTKRRHMSAFGEIRFVTASAPDETRRTLETLMEQKSRSLARKGIADIFARPGHREFFLDLASNPEQPALFHISRVEIGGACAAANFGIVFRRLLLPRAGKLRRQRHRTLRSRRAAFARAHGSRDRHGAKALRFHHRRRAVQAGMVRYRLSNCTTSPPPRPGVACQREPLQRCGAALSALSSRRRGRGAWLHAPDPPIGPLAHPLQSLSNATQRRSFARSPATQPAVACIMGDMDLLRPLALAGAPCAVVTRAGVPSLYSRYAQSRLVWADYTKNSEALVDALVNFGKAQSEPPVLFLRRRCTGAPGLASSRAFGAGVSVRHCRRNAGRGSARQGTLPGPRGTPRAAGAAGTTLRSCGV